MALTTACTVPEIIDMAKRAGLDKVADRIDYLHRLPLEDDADPMDPDSARSLVSFLIRHHRELPETGITMNPEGHVHGEWTFTEDSDLGVQFLPSGDVWFMYLDIDRDTGSLKAREKGTVSPDDMLKKIMPLVNGAT
ncbi:MAG: hypothetical protein OXP12_00870 [Thaumarchaeota archaeon]|nr:hypothetical protein [Nitrososphaerota archaeon]MDE0526393.1 hypothetical protein [Nitrososphaerota archaeon]